MSQTACYYSKTNLTLHPAVLGASMWAVGLEQAMLTYFEIEPNSRFDMHQHESEQITLVLEGTLYFEVDDRVIAVKAGETIALPSNVPHAAYTQDDAVKAVDAWSPVRREYLA